MELMEIIKSFISIFLLSSGMLVALSYTIYKVKDRSRIKPYMRVNVQPNPVAEVQNIKSRQEQVRSEQMRLEQARINNNKNENQKLEHQKQEHQLKQERMKREVRITRFKVINENTPSFKDAVPSVQ